MAIQKMIVEFDHSAKVFLAQLVRDATRAAERPAVRSYSFGDQPALNLEGFSIDTPYGIRYLWLDDTGESHWLAEQSTAGALTKGWRQALVRSGASDLVAAPDPEGPQEKAATVRLGILRTAIQELLQEVGEDGTGEDGWSEHAVQRVRALLK